MPPVFGALTKQFRTSISAEKIDVFRRSLLAEEFGVRAIPTILLARAGREVQRFEGPVSERTLRFHLERLSADYLREAPPPARPERVSFLERLRERFRGN